MNFKLKALVAAVALAACVGQAAAAPVLPTATTSSDLLFFAMDQAAGTSFVFDLGSASNLLSLNQNITGSNWTSFLAAEGNSLANVTWGLAFDQGTGGSNSMFGTTLTDTNVIGAESNAKLSAGRVVFNNVLNNALYSSVSAGGSVFTSSPSAGNYTTSMSNTWGGNAAGWTSDNAVGTAANFYTVNFASAPNGGTLIASGITFDGVSVAVAAVPEPETYSMLFAGLMMLGAIARRRKI